MRKIKWPLAALAGIVLALGGSTASAVAAPASPVGVLQHHHHHHHHGGDVDSAQVTGGWGGDGWGGGGWGW